MRILPAVLFVATMVMALISLRPRPFTGPDAPLFFEASAGSGPATFTMLTGPERRHEVQVAQAWRGLELRGLRPELNLGVHTASKSSVAVDESGLYVGSDEGRFFALDFDGHERWSLDVPVTVRGFHGTAALDEKAVYVGDYAGFFYALDKKTGALLWATRLADAVGTSALIDGEFIYVSAEYAGDGSHLSKLRRADGSMVWQTPRFAAQTHSSPALWREKGLLFFGHNQGTLFAIDEKTGGVVWLYEAKEPIKNAPVVFDGSVFFGSWSHYLERIDAEKGSLLWQTNLGDRIQSSPVILPSRGEVLLQVQGRRASLNILRLTDGRLLWKRDLAESPASNLSTPLLMRGPGSQDRVLLMCEPETLCLFDPASRRMVARQVLPGPFSGVPAFFNGRVYLALNRGGVVEITDSVKTGPSSSVGGRER